MWPPAGHDGEVPPLERCLRLYPHLQDTGGFFVALLKKTRSLDGKPRRTGGGEGKEHSQRGGCEHLRYAEVGVDALRRVQDGVGITGHGMQALSGCIFTRSQGGGGARGRKDEVVHFTRRAAGRFFGPGSGKLKTVWGGTVLCRGGEGGKLELSQEAVPLVMSLLDTTRVVTGTRTDLARLLESAGRWQT